MCPDCRRFLIGFELGGVEIDHCLGCGGTWLDAGELEMLASLEGQDLDSVRARLESLPAGRLGRRSCPRCGKRLRLTNLGGEGGEIEIDRCPRGHGFWLDRHEVTAVVASLAGAASRAPGIGGTVARFFSELYQCELRTAAKPPVGTKGE